MNCSRWWFFPRFYFIFSVLFPAHSKTCRRPILRFVLSGVIRDGSVHEDFPANPCHHAHAPFDSYFAVKWTAGARAFVARIAFERFTRTACVVVLLTRDVLPPPIRKCFRILNMQTQRDKDEALLSRARYHHLVLIIFTLPPLYTISTFQISDSISTTA